MPNRQPCMLPATHYCWVGVTVASQGQVLGHRDWAKKFVQSILWFACNSLHIVWFCLTCSWLISHEHVRFPGNLLPDFHSFCSPGHDIHIRVRRGLKFSVCSRPAPTEFKPAPHPQEFEKFCLLPPRILLTRTCPADHPNLYPTRTFSVSNPHLSKNY